MHKLIGDDIFNFIAALANEKFYDEFKSAHDIKYSTDKTKKRNFLFSDECLSKEIKYHFWVAWYAGGRNGVEKLKDFAKRSAVVDILESDVLDPKEAIPFNYYEGIRACYRNKNADPFYFPDKNKRKREVRKDWIYKKIPV